MKKILFYLVGGIMSIVGGLAWGQGHTDHAHAHHHKADKIAQELQLNETQAQQLRDIMHKYKTMMREKRTELQSQMPTQEQIESFKSFHQQMREEIRSILSEEKYRAFLEHSFDHHKQAFRHHHHHSHNIEGMPGHFGCKAERMAEFWAKELGLTDTQKEELKNLREKRMEELQEQDFDPHKIRKQMREDLKSVLTPQQLKRYKEIEKAQPGPAWKQGQATQVTPNLQTLEISAFPNPTRGTVQLRLSQSSGNLELRVLDMNGRVLQHRTIDLVDNTTVLDLSGYPKGIYSIEAKLNGYTTLTKVAVE